MSILTESMRDKLILAFDIYDINGNGQVRNYNNPQMSNQKLNRLLSQQLSFSSPLPNL